MIVDLEESVKIADRLYREKVPFSANTYYSYCHT